MQYRIVCSRAGRDKGYFMAVVGEDGGCLLVSDGKERPLSHPKRKNIKHLAFTNSYLDEQLVKTDKALRRALAQYRSPGEVKEEA